MLFSGRAAGPLTFVRVATESREKKTESLERGALIRD